MAHLLGDAGAVERYLAPTLGLGAFKYNVFFSWGHPPSVTEVAKGAKSALGSLSRELVHLAGEGWDLDDGIWLRPRAQSICKAGREAIT